MVYMVRQGDILLEKVDFKASSVKGEEIPPEADGALVLAHGEETGHRHAFYNSKVALFKDTSLIPDMQDETLYIGHLIIDQETAELRHEEHDTITLESGVWRVRRQREFDSGLSRLVLD